jgi:superfamily II DNA or RNA helicase
MITIKKRFIIGQEKTFLDPAADVYILGVEKANHIDKDEFRDIGLVIYDEAHVATITACTSTLLKFKPRYLIGLSATPDRGDGMEKVMEPYFGPVEGAETLYIVRCEKKPFTIVKIETAFEPEVSHMILFGKKVLDWTSVKKSLEYNKERWEFIVEQVMKAPEIGNTESEDIGKGKIMIISWSVCQSEGVSKLLQQRGVRVAKLFGSDVKNYPGMSKEKREIAKANDLCNATVIVGGLKKASVGFNDPDLTSAYIISDIGDVRQAEGRIRAKNCIIYDFVDNFRLLETHWKIRKDWYMSRGATIIVNKRSK